MAGRQTGRWTGRHPCTETETQTQKQTDRRTDRPTDRQTGWLQERQACGAADIKAGREVARQSCTIGSRTGSWRRKETWGQQVPLAEEESEIEEDRNKGREKERKKERERERDEVSARLAG